MIFSIIIRFAGEPFKKSWYGEASSTFILIYNRCEAKLLTLTLERYLRKNQK